MPTLILIVFINLLGFGILLPLIPFYAVKLDLSITAVTFVTMGVYSLAQFVASPFVGKLSDRFGRKPILAVTMFGTSLSYVLLMFADSVELLIISRILSGLNAGNLATAFAYVADTTTEDNRAKGLGLLGAALGMGFVIGPALGGLLAGESMETANYVAPALASSILSSIAAFGVIFFLKESLSDEVRQKLKSEPKLPFGDRLRVAFGRQTLALLVLTGFVYMIAFAMFETIYPLWGADALALGPQGIGFTLLYIGIISVIIQGGAIGPLSKKFGEHKLVLTALILVGVGLIALSNSFDLWSALASLTLISIGSSLFNPSISSLISKGAEATEQGAVLGIFQGAGSLARVIGPIVAGPLADMLGFGAPYVLGAILIVPTVVMVLRLLQENRKNLAKA